jgi:demethylmenaquinone methyltransferase/2-methoxy-6-polyprenyl-1,4-benzoquinol methylase
MKPSPHAESQEGIHSSEPRGRVRVVGSEVRAMFGSIAKRYDLANTFLSLGIHKWWRRKLKKLWGKEDRGPVLDLCTGTGDVLSDLKGSFQTSIGADFCLPMLVKGQDRYGHTTLLQADAQHLPFPENVFHVVTVSFGIRNVESLARGLSEIHRVLVPGGVVLILEFGQPANPMWRAVFQWYSTWILPVLGALITGNRAAYEYLPATSRTFPCREHFLNELTEAGYEKGEYYSLTGGIAYIYRGVK